MIKFKLFNFSNIKSPQKKAIVLMSLLIFISLLLLSLIFLYQNINKCSSCLYNQDGIRVTKKEYAEALQARKIFYEYINQDFNTEILEEDIKNQLIEDKKLLKLAIENNIEVSDDEIQKVYDERVRQAGSESKLLETISKMYGYDKNNYLNQIEKDFLIEKISQINIK